MGVSIYYEASRSTPITPEEQKTIDEVIKKYSVADQIEKFLNTGVGWSGEDFSCYPPPFDRADVIFQGATGLPVDSVRSSIAAAKHWCLALTEIHGAVPDAEWSVNIDDAEIPWSEEQQAFVLEEYSDEEPDQAKPIPKRIPQKKTWYLPIIKFLRLLFPPK